MNSKIFYFCEIDGFEVGTECFGCECSENTGLHCEHKTLVNLEDEELAIKQANELLDEELMVQDVYAEQESNYWRDAI